MHAYVYTYNACVFVCENCAEGMFIVCIMLYSICIRLHQTLNIMLYIL